MSVAEPEQITACVRAAQLWWHIHAQFELVDVVSHFAWEWQ